MVRVELAKGHKPDAFSTDPPATNKFVLVIKISLNHTVDKRFTDNFAVRELQEGCFDKHQTPSKICGLSTQW